MTAFVEQDSRASDDGTIDKASGFETSSPGKRPLLFIAIGTAARYTERRRAIRDSWLRWAVNDGGEELVRHLFYTDVDNAADKETIDEEHRIYNDIVMLPTATGRHGYGYRGVATIQHAHTAMVDAPYLLKMDDDGREANAFIVDIGSSSSAHHYRATATLFSCA